MTQVFELVSVISAVPLYCEPSRLVPSTLYLPPIDCAAADWAARRPKAAANIAFFILIPRGLRGEPSRAGGNSKLVMGAEGNPAASAAGDANVAGHRRSFGAPVD